MTQATAKTYRNLNQHEKETILKHWELLVNTGGSSCEHVLDLLNDFKRENNRDLTVNLPRYLLGFGISCQVALLHRIGI